MKSKIINIPADASFRKFYRITSNKNFQQVLAMEYNEFAKGAATITEIDFARILLRYTFLHAEEYELILERWVTVLLSVQATFQTHYMTLFKE